MAVKVRIPAPLQTLTQNLGLLEVEGATVGEVLLALEERYPGFHARLYDASGELLRFVNIYVNEEDIRFLQGVATPLSEGDEVSIIPAIAGG
jgi:molybdopterin synthase sulfur carrier subunit